MKLLNLFINFSRKNRIFNKSRYSRNRQNVRVIFYFGLYFNIFIIYLIFSLFYSIIPLLTYNWWFFFLFILSFFISNFIKIIQK
jgi:hypothetical protein